MQETILAISGKAGLFKLVGRGNNTLIVETIDETHRRTTAGARDRVTSLADVTMYTEADDVPPHASVPKHLRCTQGWAHFFWL